MSCVSKLVKAAGRCADLMECYLWLVGCYPLSVVVLIDFIVADNWPLNMQLLEEGEVVEDHSGQAQFTTSLTDQVGNAMWHKVEISVQM